MNTKNMDKTYTDDTQQWIEQSANGEAENKFANLSDPFLSLGDLDSKGILKSGTVDGTGFESSPSSSFFASTASIGGNHGYLSGLGDDDHGQYVLANGNRNITGALLMQSTLQVNDKILFTQSDGNEYIDSLADGYMDYRATTAHRFGDGTNQLVVAADGLLTLEGTARVLTTEWISVEGFKAPGTKPAAQVDYGLGGGWEFSDATDDTVVATKRLPVGMDKTVTPSFKIGWGSAETAGDVVWQLEYLYVTAGESLANTTPDDTVSETTTVSGTANGLNVTTIAMDAPSATDQLLKVRVKRLGADGDDTLSGTVILIGCGFNYTADKLGVAT